MEWFKRMDQVVTYIEVHLTDKIKHQSLARIVGCSVYEFSRIFSFMTGLSISEYIRRRRLSQSVFDIQNGKDKILDIALKYGYESQAAFTRAFKELHHQTPTAARKQGTTLKTYPPLSFKLTIQGVTEMNFKIEEKESFKVIGLSGYLAGELVDGMPTVIKDFYENYAPKLGEYYTAPLWQVSVYDFESTDDKVKVVIGAEYKGKKPDALSLTFKDVPAATWVVFSIEGCIGETYDAAYARILTEWFPTSSYKRDETIPHLEVLPTSSEIPVWEIWMPVTNK